MTCLDRLRAWVGSGCVPQLGAPDRGDRRRPGIGFDIDVARTRWRRSCPSRSRSRQTSRCRSEAVRRPAWDAECRPGCLPQSAGGAASGREPTVCPTWPAWLAGRCRLGASRPSTTPSPGPGGAAVAASFYGGRGLAATDLAPGASASPSAALECGRALKPTTSASPRSRKAASDALVTSQRSSMMSSGRVASSLDHGTVPVAWEPRVVRISAHRRKAPRWRKIDIRGTSTISGRRDGWPTCSAGRSAAAIFVENPPAS